MLLPASQFIHLLDPAIHVLTPNPWHTPQTRALAWTLWGKKSEVTDISRTALGGRTGFPVGRV